MEIWANPVSAGDHGADVEELQSEAIRLLSVGVALGIFAFLAAAAVDPAVREPHGMWLVVLSLVVTTILPYRICQRSASLAAFVLVVGFLASVLIGVLVYPGSQVVYGLALVGMAGATFLGLRGFLVASFISSALAIALTVRPDGPLMAGDVGPAVVLIWACGALCWVASRPTSTALDWSMRSYNQAREMTEALRDRQGELVRISHDLEVACERLEEANRELDRARRQAEEARKLKNEFAAAISHELRTPLNLVIGFSEMLIRELRARPVVSMPTYVQGDVEAIYRNACHISNLVDDVLDLSQVDAHRLALQKQHASLVQIIEDVRGTLGTMFDEAGLGLRVELPEDLPLLHVDPLRIRQVLINLLNNAARFTDEGEVVVTARCEDRQVVVTVADTGDGIPIADLPWVFEEFHRAGNASRRRGGSGLGLAVTRRFVELHGGSIWVESKLGEGSVFRFSLPLQEQIVAVPHSQNWGRLLGPTAKPGRTLVVVDSEPEPARLLRSYLDGYRVLASDTLAEAAQLAKSEGAQALVLTKPVSSCDLKDLARDQGIPSHTAVLACELRTPQVIGLEMEVAAYLVKPVQRDTLLAALHKAAPRLRSVLVVDDDPELADLLSRMVRQAHRRCKVRRAGDGGAALSLLRAEKPDVVLLDLLMPKTDGYEVIAEMKLDPELRGVPVVVVTARSAEEEAIRADYLTISRAGGLTVGELVRSLKGCLDALLT